MDRGRRRWNAVVKPTVFVVRDEQERVLPAPLLYRRVNFADDRVASAHRCAGVLRVAPQRRGQERVARQASVLSVVNEALKVGVCLSAVVLANPGQRQFRSKAPLLVIDTPR